jgi:hypothetical protein
MGYKQGPREQILEFFESMGFKCPERKGVAYFLQEVSVNLHLQQSASSMQSYCFDSHKVWCCLCILQVTSRKDQEQYWTRHDDPHCFVMVQEFAEAFQSFREGRRIGDELAAPYI